MSEQTTLRGKLWDRFHDKVEMTEDCWNWTAAKRPSGYGNFWDGEKTVAAHRISYRTYHGSIPDDKQINHKCHNESCVNPAHLYVGTQSENLQDAKDDGWEAEKNHNKLNEEKVIEIRKRHQEEDITCVELAEDYEVTGAAISKIVNMKSWTNVNIDTGNES